MHQEHKRAPRSQQDAVWAELYARQRPAAESGMCRAFVEGIVRAGLDPTRMPRHAALSRRLFDLCGWRIEIVPGLIPVPDFFALLRDRRFPSPEWIRHQDDLEYTPEPDLFHDVFGHVPQLVTPSLVEIIETLAELSRHADEQRLAEIERVYWYTIEFGLVHDGGAVRALGAGLASSVAELRRSLESSDVIRRPFDVATTRGMAFDHERPQPTYFVARSVATLPEEIADRAGRRACG